MSASGGAGVAAGLRKPAQRLDGRAPGPL